VHADYGAPVNSSILNQNVVKLTLFPQQIGQPLHVNWSDPIEAKQWQIDNDAIAVPSVASAGVSVSRESKKLVLKITGQLAFDAQPESVSLAVVDPDEYFLQHFRRALAAAGIQEIPGTRRYVQTLVNSENVNLSSVFEQLEKMKFSQLFNELAFVESPPLSELLKETNQNSNNLYAEALLRVLGAKVGKLTSFTDSTAQMGLQVVKETLATLGVDPSGYVMADSSGLSRHNLATPEAIAQTLRVMAKSPLAAVYRASLPVAGISGTLQNRFRNTTAQGIVQAKTGTLSGAVALSGYIEPVNYEPLVFSIIVNQSNRPSTALRQASDRIVLLLTSLHRC
jgi:D-alanyl-D-alanine carboxypeptidase/D-alanyl-D-alanine-endopeptidase (penicillin-binding protein 4)